MAVSDMIKWITKSIQILRHTGTNITKTLFNIVIIVIFLTCNKMQQQMLKFNTNKKKKKETNTHVTIT